MGSNVAVEPGDVGDASVTSALNLRKKRRLGEMLIQGFLFISGALSIFTTIGIVYILSTESLAFFTRPLWENTNKRLVIDISPAATTFEITTSGKPIFPEQIVRIGNEIMEVVAVDGELLTVTRGFQGTAIEAHRAGLDVYRANRVTPLEIFSKTRWEPQLGNFGIWPLILATLTTSFIGMLVALPLGLASAIYLSEYASHRARSILKPILEVLAGVPTVVYGYFALTFMTPLLRNIFGDQVQIFNTASAGIVIGILIVPLVSSMSEDALHAVPNSLRQAAYGLGATKLEPALKVVLPAALSGIAAAFVVAISRAVGETMVVAIAAGAGPRNFTIGEDPWLGFVFNPFIAAETMTGHIVRISGGDLSYDSIDYNSIFAIGLMLFLMTLGLNLLSQRIVRRFREVYE
jgi:phosphate transport system permease protein